MRHRAKLRVAAMTATLGAVALLAIPAGGAHADTTASLPITSFYQIVADTAHGHLFISEGSSSINHILVTDLTGQQVATIGSQDGVMGIALSPDGKILYAALSASHAVSAIDTSTLQETATYSTGDSNTPQDLAVQSGKVWVSYNTGTAGAAAIGDIDLSANPPVFKTQSVMGSWYSAPEIAADPQDTGVIIAAEPSLTPSSVASYDVSNDPPTVTASSSSFQNCENEEDVAVAPGGAEFILACGWPYAHYRYKTADLSQQGSYASTFYPSSVAIAANGDVAVGTSNGVNTNPDLFVYAPGGDTPLNTFNFLNSGANLVARGLAWSADASKLFAVTVGQGSSTYSLQVIDDPTLQHATLSLNGPATATLGTSVMLTGSLTLSGGGTLPAGTPVTITRTVAGGAGTQTFDVTTAADGSFSLTDTPPAVGQYMYTASYAGSTMVAPATASHTVNVTLKPAALTLAAGRSSVRYKSPIHVTAHLGATATNRTVSIYAQPFGSASKTLLKTGAVNSSGNLTVSYVAAHSTTFSAVFAGDAKYGPATATRQVHVLAKVTMTLRGNYGTRRVGHIRYLLYHPSSHVKIAIRVAPNKRGQCVKLQVQEYFRGHWHGAMSGCFTLSAASTLTGYLTVRHANLNRPYRIRADYNRGSDFSNLSSDSVWRYLMVER